MITTLNPAPRLNSKRVYRQRADYFQAVARGHPSEMLVAALERYEGVPSSPARCAINLGYQDGCDTVELLRRKWQVLSMEGEPDKPPRWHRRQNFDPPHLDTRMQHPKNGFLPTGVDLN
ncbi:hypothetical protein [Acaryochloris sp. IP29b_bin.137]|uniref:hypothetical protein n=1 Tax=Acaryochloris sp. IP29b_bin.137 TaxID=2969217 RepID=UPI0026057DF2|nr:hypothetical protein [Acaryochloris sp. IP29b_bin.137]